ncbi:MAG: hypothetical protein NVSMB17_06750 [Candidatus Dormibacteria bacterium]
MSTDADLVLARAADLLQDCSPVDAEVFASGAIGLAYAPGNDSQEDELLLLVELSERVEAKPTAEGLALLLALARVADSAGTELVLEAARRISRGSVKAPSWAAAIENGEVVEAWVGADAHGDHEVALGVFRHPGHGPHALQVMFDRNLGGAIMDAAVLLEPDALIEHWGRQVPMRPLHPDRLSWMLARGMAAADAAGNPAAPSDDYRQTRGVVRARMRDLPPPAPDDQPMDASSRAALLADFLGSEESRGTDAPPSLVEAMFEFRIDHGDGEPLRWSPVLVGMFMADWFPRGVLAEERDIASLPATLRALVRYGARQRGVAPRITAEVIEAVKEFEPEFQRACRDVALFTPVKRMHTRMVADGVDPEDERAVSAWVERFNRWPAAERREVLEGPGK